MPRCWRSIERRVPMAEKRDQCSTRSDAEICSEEMSGSADIAAILTSIQRLDCAGELKSTSYRKIALNLTIHIDLQAVQCDLIGARLRIDAVFGEAKVLRRHGAEEAAEINSVGEIVFPPRARLR